MRRFPFAPLAVAAAAVVLVATPSPALLRKMRYIPPPHTRLATADVAVIGEVTGIEKEMVEAVQYPGGTKAEYRVAVVAVATNLHGAGNVTHVKVGFVPTGRNHALDDFDSGDRNIPTDLAEGQQYCFFLQKHADAGFYVMPQTSPSIEVSDKVDGQFDDLKKAAATLRAPLKALASKDDDERLLAARMLVLKYRGQRYNGVATAEELVPLEESQLVLKAFAEVPWTVEQSDMNGEAVFNMIGLTHVDKFNRMAARPDQDQTEPYRVELKRWLAADGAKYQIKKLVPKK